jgi:hypothetical protein
MSIPDWLRRSWLAQGLETFLLSSSLTCCVLDGSSKLCPSGIFPSSIFRWCTWEIATPPDPFVFSRNLLPRKCGRCFRIFRRSAKRTEMEWIEVCIYIEVVHVLYPLQGFDQGTVTGRAAISHERGVSRVLTGHTVLNLILNVNAEHLKREPIRSSSSRACVIRCVHRRLTA